MMERLYYAMRSHNSLLNILLEQLRELTRKLDRVGRRLDEDKECVHAFHSVAREVMQRRHLFESSLFEPEDDEDDEEDGE